MGEVVEIVHTLRVRGFDIGLMVEKEIGVRFKDRGGRVCVTVS